MFQEFFDDMPNITILPLTIMTIMPRYIKAQYAMKKM
jgi:hypothetical protein